MKVVAPCLHLDIRVRKEEAAFVTFTLDAWEGVASHTTLPHVVGEPDRWLRLSFHASCHDLLIHILKELPIEEVKVASGTSFEAMGT